VSSERPRPPHAERKAPHSRFATMRMKITTDQFELNGEKLTHAPTGAQFWMGERDVILCEPGKAGRALSSGHEYDTDELREAAWKILQTEKTRCV